MHPCVAAPRLFVIEILKDLYSDNRYYVNKNASLLHRLRPRAMVSMFQRPSPRRLGELLLTQRHVIGWHDKLDWRSLICIRFLFPRGRS